MNVKPTKGNLGVQLMLQCPLGSECWRGVTVKAETLARDTVRDANVSLARRAPMRGAFLRRGISCRRNIAPVFSVIYYVVVTIVPMWGWPGDGLHA